MTNWILPDYIFPLLEKLHDAGYEAFLVGGCVRDQLFGRPLSDYDVTTNALPEEMKEVFADFPVLETGIMHGTITVLCDHHPVEITTYRIDGDYLDHRKPDTVTFTRDLKEDLCRRDFTINAMAYSPKTGLIDLYGGQADLADRTLRCVGNAKKRFTEDALRILRGLRFAASLGLTIEDETAGAIHDCAAYLADISAERKCAELTKLLLAPYCDDSIVRYRDVLTICIPALTGCKTLYSLSSIPAELSLRLAVLLTGLSAVEAENALLRLRFDKETIRQTVLLLSDSLEIVTPDRISVRQLLSRYGVEDLRRKIDYQAAVGGMPQENRDAILALIDAILTDGDAFTRGMLKITGSDLQALGFSGRRLGDVLQILLDAVMADQVKNTRQALLAFAAAMIE